MDTFPLKNKINSLLIFVLSVCVALAIAEGVVRAKNSAMTNYNIEMWKYSQELKKPSTNALLGHEHIKSTSGTFQSVDIRINEWGLRGGAVPPSKPGERRILVLGSSITLGWGVREEVTMTANLQNMFGQDGKRALVLNAGIGNYNAVRYVERFLTKLAGLQPTDIVILYFVNDAEELGSGGGNFLLRHSQVAVTLWFVIKRLLLGAKESDLVEHYRSVYKPGTQGVKDMQKALTKLRDHATRENIRLFLAMMPDVHNLTEYKLGFVHDIMMKNAKELGYAFIDLFPAFKNMMPEDIWSLPGDPHPNALGHKLISQALYPVLATAP